MKSLTTLRILRSVVRLYSNDKENKRNNTIIIASEQSERGNLLKILSTFIVYSFFISHSRVASHTISTEISAGLTPEILPACPKFKGFTRSSFSLASILKPRIDE